MSSKRISKETAELCPLPPYSWYWKPASVILERSTVKSNLDKVALNEPLMENLKKESIKNPFLCLSNWWPLVGSQRLRAIREIRETDKDYDPLLQIAHFISRMKMYGSYGKMKNLDLKRVQFNTSYGS